MNFSAAKIAALKKRAAKKEISHKVEISWNSQVAFWEFQGAAVGRLQVQTGPYIDWPMELVGVEINLSWGSDPKEKVILEKKTTNTDAFIKALNPVNINIDGKKVFTVRPDRENLIEFNAPEAIRERV